MKKDEMHNLLEHLEKPTAALPVHEARLRLAYVNARSSAWWGIALLLLPMMFVTSALLKYGLGFSSPFDALQPLFTAIDQISIGAIRLSPLLFVGGLALAILLNVLAVTHFSAGANGPDLVIEIAVKRKPLNLLMIFVAAAVLSILFAYAIGENFQARPH